jgi:hypothetical protein
MYHNIIKDAVSLDKEARDKLKALEETKAALDSVIQSEQDALEKTMKAEIKRVHDAQKKTYEDEITKRRESALRQYEETLKALSDQYWAHKDEWVDTIVDAIVK